MKIKLGLSNSIRVGSLGFPKCSIADVTYSISGTVFDSDGSTAVSGATVAIGSSSTTSAANGTYSITGLAAGTSGNLTVTKTGYIYGSIAVSAMAGNLTSQNFINAWYRAGTIAPIAAWQPHNASSLAASYVNLVNAGIYDANPQVAPTLDAKGWVGNSSAWLKTGLTAAVLPLHPLNYTAAIRVYPTDLSFNTVGIGRGVSSPAVWTLGTKNIEIPRSATTISITLNAANGIVIAGTKVWVNGTNIATLTTSADAASEVGLLCRYDGTNPQGILSNAYLGAACVLNSVISDANAAMLSAALALADLGNP